MTRQVLVVGGGPAGLKAAHALIKRGFRVTILESAPVLGGMASSFDCQGVAMERYYHFICRGDDHLLDTLSELGLDSRLRWAPSKMGYFVDGRLHPFITPLDLLRFTPLRLVNRIRAGIALKLAQRMSEEDLAPQTAVSWLIRLFGEETYRVVWEPLLLFKFAHYAPYVSAAWIWARMVRLSRSRTSVWREELGYLEGGSKTVLEALERDFVARGGEIRLNAQVERILVGNGIVTGAVVDGEVLRGDAVISSIAISRFLPLCPTIDSEYASRLKRIPIVGIFCLFLRMKRPLTPLFWVNVNDKRVPFAGLIEYTNLNPMPEMGGDHVLYVPQYLPVEDPRFTKPEDELMREYVAGLKIINPAFHEDWIVFSRVFRDPQAQPICLTDYRQTTPPICSPIPNLFLTDSCQLHPHDRSISGAFGLALKAAQCAGDWLDGRARPGAKALA